MSTDGEMILITEAQNQRQKQHDHILKRVFIFKIIAKTLMDYQPTEKNSENQESIERALKVLRVQEYLQLNEEGNETLLNLGEYCESITLSYTQQKYLRKYLTEELSQRFSRLTPFIQKIKSDLPSLFNLEPSTDDELITLEEQRRANMKKLAELKSRKIKLLKSALDFKLGPHVTKKLEILLAEMRLNQTKANLMRSYIINELVSRSENSFKAIKEVEGYIDKRLEDYNREKEEKKALNQLKH